MGVVLSVAAGPAIVAAVLLAVMLWIVVAVIGFCAAIVACHYVVWHLAAYSRLPSFIGRWGQDNPDSVLNELEAAPLSPPVRTASHRQANQCRFFDRLADGM